MLEEEAKRKLFIKEFHKFYSTFHTRGTPKKMKKKMDRINYADELSENLTHLRIIYPNKYPLWDEAYESFLAWDSAMNVCCDAITYGKIGSFSPEEELQYILRTGSYMIEAILNIEERLTNPHYDYRPPYHRLYPFEYIINCEEHCIKWCEEIASRYKLALPERKEKHPPTGILRSIRRILKLDK